MAATAPRMLTSRGRWGTPSQSCPLPSYSSSNKKSTNKSSNSKRKGRKMGASSTTTITSGSSKGSTLERLPKRLAWTAASPIR